MAENGNGIGRRGTFYQWAIGILVSVLLLLGGGMVGRGSISGDVRQCATKLTQHDEQIKQIGDSLKEIKIGQAELIQLLMNERRKQREP
jgi:hypothetical protein